MLSLCRAPVYPKISSVLQADATRDENIDALVARYGTQAHPDHHPIGSNNADASKRKNEADQKIQRSEVTTNEDASTRKSNQLKTNNANKSDRTTQYCEDASHHGDGENSKLNEERQKCEDASRDENSKLNEESRGGMKIITHFPPSSLWMVFVKDSRIRWSVEKIKSEHLNVPSMPMITTVHTILTA